MIEMSSSDAAAAALTMPTWLFLLIVLACWGAIIAGGWMVLRVLLDATLGRRYRRKIERIEAEIREAEEDAR